MAKRPSKLRMTTKSRPTRDSELCKVVFGAAISQILYARRAFPPSCFQVLPLEQFVSRSFEDIVASGPEVEVYDKEHLRDQRNTVFLRQGTEYGTSRFLGILRADIFPLLDSERLVKFRVNFLQNNTWKDGRLAEYYTITFKYEPDGTYGMDIWRAGMGNQHISASDTHLWNLGDYLSRLPIWTEPMHWTLAFHATERPDEPPIGVWKFDRTEFDDANLSLQQMKEYAYARIARLEIMPPTPADVDDAILDVSSDPEPNPEGHSKPECQPPKYQAAEVELPRASTASQSQKKRKRAPKSAPKSNVKRSALRRQRDTAPQLTPPLTLPSSRNVSKNASADSGDVMDALVESRKSDSRIAQHSSSPQRKRLPVAKRKPKRPLQLFEEVTSSLPPTQIIGESQTLSQRTQLAKASTSSALTQQRDMTPQVPRSSSPVPCKLLDGIPLSSDAISATHSSPSVALPYFPPPLASTQLFDSTMFFTDDDASGLRLGPSSSVYGLPFGTQWEPQASPPPQPTQNNLLGIAISDDEDATASEAEEKEAVKVIPRPHMQREGEADMSFEFEHRPTARTASSLFYDMPDDSEDEQ